MASLNIPIEEKNIDMVIPMWRYDDMVIAEHELKAAREKIEELEVKLAAMDGYLTKVNEDRDLAMKQVRELRKTLSEYENRSRSDHLAMLRSYVQTIPGRTL